MPSSRRLLTVLVGLSVVTTACGVDDSTSDTTGAEVLAAPAASTTSAPPGTSTTVTQPVTTTAAATTTTVIELLEVVPGEDADVDAIVEVYQVVFDSTTTYEEKAPLIDDPGGLEATVETYAATGESVGGVTALPTQVGISGEMAQVLYTLYFSGNPTYPDLKGDAILTNEGWKISRDMFCRVMASARSSCPSG